MHAHRRAFAAERDDPLQALPIGPLAPQLAKRVTIMKGAITRMGASDLLCHVLLWHGLALHTLLWDLHQSDARQIADDGVR